MKLEREAERVSPTGNMASSGILNQLGRPTMNPVTVLIREAVQNSWDARLSDGKSVLFRLDGWVSTAAQRSVLAEQIFADCPPPETLPLMACLASSEDLSLLAVSDRGTTGLGGPSRADKAALPGEDYDFVDFLRNVGQPQRKRFAGGTYGYGKASFYRLSRARTICVYTRCRTATGLESRFTAAALGGAFISEGVRHTGRHWWGEYREGVVEPILNTLADRLASALGLPTFENEELGTTIVIIQPQFTHSIESEEPEGFDQVYSRMVEDILLYCWPKMLVNDTETPPMRFAVTWQGNDLAIPEPADYPPLQGFVQALQRLKNPEIPNSLLRHTVTPIASKRPAKHLGQLALQQILSPPTVGPRADNPDHSSFTKLTHHTALMRQPELIVNYVAGPAPASPYVGYTGTFLVDADVDNVFAAAETPTHDAWVREALEHRTERMYINVALKSIDREMITFAHPPQLASTAPLAPLGAFASVIGDSLIPTVAGPTARPGTVSDTRTPGATNMPHSDHVGSVDSNNQASKQEFADTGQHVNAVGSADANNESNRQTTSTPTNQVDPPLRPGRAQVRLLSDGHFVVADGTPALQIPFDVMHTPRSDGTIIQVIAKAVLDGGQLETEPPVGGSQARVLEWIAPDGGKHYGMDIIIPIQIQGTWHVLMTVPTDIVLSVELRAAAWNQP